MSSSPSLFLDCEKKYFCQYFHIHSIFSTPQSDLSIWWFLVLLKLIFLSFGIILVALLCTLSSISISFLRYGLHACIQYSKWGLTIVLYSGIISSFSLYTIFCLINPRIWFPFVGHIHLTVYTNFEIFSPESFETKLRGAASKQVLVNPRMY